MPRHSAGRIGLLSAVLMVLLEEGVQCSSLNSASRTTERTTRLKYNPLDNADPIYSVEEPYSFNKHKEGNNQDFNKQKTNNEKGQPAVKLRNGIPINSFQNFNISLFEQDPEFHEFVRSTLPRAALKSAFSANFPGSDKVHVGGQKVATARKYFTLQQMIMFFQVTPMFGKFNYYGCWCFPDGANEMMSGYGDPVDDIDKLCKRMNQCYKCASMRYGKSECPSNTEYKFQGLEDPVTGQRYVDCLDPEGSCPRSLCECDKKMASSIADHEHEWEEAYHSKWGAFNREQTCRTSLSAFNWGHSMGRGHRFGGSGSGGGNQQDACCGQEGEKFPYNSDGGRRGCCEGRTYSTELMKCCPRDGVKSLEAKCF